MLIFVSSLSFSEGDVKIDAKLSNLWTNGKSLIEVAATKNSVPLAGEYLTLKILNDSETVVYEVEQLKLNSDGSYQHWFRISDSGIYKACLNVEGVKKTISFRVDHYYYDDDDDYESDNEKEEKKKKHKKTVDKNKIVIEDLIPGSPSAEIDAVISKDEFKRLDKEMKRILISIPVSNRSINIVLPAKELTEFFAEGKDVELETEDLAMVIDNESFDLDGVVLDDLKIGCKVSDESDIKKVKEKVSFKEKSKHESKEIYKILDFSITYKDAGKEKSITKFKKKIVNKVKLDVEKDKELFVVYYFNEETNQLEYVPSKIDDKGQLEFRTNHFSKFVIMKREVEFKDQLPTWAEKEIKVMAAKEIINGNQGNFFPEDSIKRSEFVKLIVKAMNLEIQSYNDDFDDVNTADWYAGYVATAKHNGLISGNGNNTFEPNEVITREEMAVILDRALNSSENEAGSILNFDDSNDISQWSMESIKRVVGAGLMNGKGSTFDPKGNAQRSEAAVVTYRLFNKR